MSKPKPKRAPKGPPQPPAPNKALPINLFEGSTPKEMHRDAAAQAMAPELAAARVVLAAEHGHVVSDLLDTAGMLDALRAQNRAVSDGDMRQAEAMLMSQATALQSLSVRLFERAVSQQWVPQMETFFRLGLKAQAQSRQTIETLANLRNGPTIFARQANVAAGAPMQVNNGLPERPGARQTEKPPTQLLEANSGQWVDARAAREAGGGDKVLAPVGEEHRAEKR